MVKSLSESKVQKYIERIVNELKNYNPRKIILFGSRAKGTYKKGSDIDIAVDIDLDFREKRKLKEKIDTLSGLYTVDLIFLPEVGEDFKKRVLKEGVILYEKK
jgi:predicted nucleotidyltransferase